jgi:hypothetical protein
MVYQEQSWLTPYLASQQNAGQKFVSEYVKPIETAAVSVAGTLNSQKIKEIIADETAKAKIRPGLTPVDAEGNATGPAAKGGLDYRSLERRLLPYDAELSAKYGKLADEQEEKELELKKQSDLTAWRSSMVEAKATKTPTVYTPEQKQLIDAKQQNRIQMDRAMSSMNTALDNKDKTNYDYWMAQVTALKAKDTELNDKLAALGLSGYSKVGEEVKTGETKLVEKPEVKPYELAKQLVDRVLDVKNGFTTKSKKDVATQELINYNATLGSFPLSENELASLNLTISNAKVPAADTSGKNADKFVNEFLTALDLKPLVKSLTEARRSLINTLGEYKAGNYATTNLKVFKDVMGAMSAGEYGIATDSKVGALLSALPKVGESLSTAVAVGKFNSKEDATTRLTNAIDAYNETINNLKNPSSMVSDEALNSAGFSRDQFVKSMNSSGAYQAVKNIPSVNSLEGKSNEPVDDVSKYQVWNKAIGLDPKQTTYKVDEKVRVGQQVYTVIRKPDGTFGIDFK